MVTRFNPYGNESFIPSTTGFDPFSALTFPSEGTSRTLTPFAGSAGPAAVGQPQGYTPAGPTATPYPTTLPALSPEMMEAIERRRSATVEREQRAETMFEDARLRAEAERILGLRRIGEDVGEVQRQRVSQLAGRGVARSPIFLNPELRRLATVQGRAIGELEAGVASKLEELRGILEGERQAVTRERAQIDFDTVFGRSDVGRLLGVS